VLYLFWGSLANAVAFGSVLGKATEGQMGATETLMATAALGMLYPLLCGQVTWPHPSHIHPLTTSPPHTHTHFLSTSRSTEQRTHAGTATTPTRERQLASPALLACVASVTHSAHTAKLTPFLSPQPLTIMGATGPIVAFIIALQGLGDAIGVK
jgi:hypothetical protein